MSHGQSVVRLLSHRSCHGVYVMTNWKRRCSLRRQLEAVAAISDLIMNMRSA